MTRPRVYYGWWTILALSITETVSFGILYYAYTVFVYPMAESFSAPIALVAGAYSLGLVVSGLCAESVGRYLDRHGARGLMTAGSLAAGALLMLWSFVDSLPGLYAVWMALGVAMSMVLYEPAFAVVAVWFDRKRSHALTALTLTAGLASVIFLPLTGYLTDTHGWRDALRVLALILWLITVPLHALILRRNPEAVGQGVDGLATDAPPPPTRGRHRPTPESVVPTRAIRTPAFALLTISFTASMMVIVALGVQLVPLLLARGLSPLEAAGVGGLIGVTAMPGRIIFTPLGAVISRHFVTAAIFASQAAGLLALLYLPGNLGLTTFVILYGLGFGAITPARAALMVETFGPRWFGTISGRSVVIGTLFRAGAPIGLGLLLDRSHDLSTPLWTLTLLVLIASATVALAGRYPVSNTEQNGSSRG
jgi:MFS family permease